MSTSLGFIIGIIVASVILLASVAGLFLAIRWRRHADSYDDTGAATASIVTCAIAIVATVVISAIAFYPYDMQYHQWRPVSGTVQVVDVRIQSDGAASSQNYAVRLTDGQTYRCDDTRCSLLKPGDTVSLKCIREWQYASTSGWGCRFVSSVPGGDR
jgi:hypothetical protein